MRQRGRADRGRWAAGAWRDARWLGLYWAVFAVLCAWVGRWAYLGCLAEGPAGACGAPALYLGVVLAALPSAAVVALTAALVLMLRRRRRPARLPAAAVRQSPESPG